MYPLVIFDLDSTLYQCPEYFDAFRELLMHFIWERREKRGLEMLYNIRAFTGRWSERAIFALDIPWGEWIEYLCQEAPVELISPNPERVCRIQSLPGRKVVYTYSPRDLALVLLGQIGFDLSEFDLIIGSEKTDRMPIKGVHSSHMFRYIALLYPECDIKFSVGDSWKADLAPAKKAGFTTVGIGRDGLGVDEADMWFETVEDFVDFYHTSAVGSLRASVMGF